MDGQLRPDAGNFFAVGITAFILVWIIDRALRYFGLNTWTTSGQ